MGQNETKPLPPVRLCSRDCWAVLRQQRLRQRTKEMASLEGTGRENVLRCSMCTELLLSIERKETFSSLEKNLLVGMSPLYSLSVLWQALPLLGAN